MTALPQTPRHGDRIMIFNPHWLQLILSGQKTLEIRSKRLRGGTYFLGCHGVIHGVASFKTGVSIGYSEWAALRGEHCIESDTPPYTNSFGLRVRAVMQLPEISYIHRRGAISIVKYRG